MSHVETCQLGMNDSGTCGKIDTPLTQRRSRAVRKEFELIDASGNVVARSVCGLTLAIVAGQMFPTQQQDPDRTGAGWDIQVVGAK